jgi:hypothetical protein
MRGRSLTNNVVIATIVAILLSFAGLYFIFPPHALSVLLNGLFAGAMTAIGVTYHKLLWDAWFNSDDFNRVRQMTLTIGGQWLVISLFIIVSIYANIAYLPPTVYMATLFARWLATVIAILQVTAPDYGDGLFYGADRKFLLLGLIIGASTGVGAILIQGF